MARMREGQDRPWLPSTACLLAGCHWLPGKVCLSQDCVSLFFHPGQQHQVKVQTPKRPEMAGKDVSRGLGARREPRGTQRQTILSFQKRANLPRAFGSTPLPRVF